MNRATGNNNSNNDNDNVNDESEDNVDESVTADPYRSAGVINLIDILIQFYQLFKNFNQPIQLKGPNEKNLLEDGNAGIMIFDHFHAYNINPLSVKLRLWFGKV